MLIPNRTSEAYDFNLFDKKEKEPEIKINSRNVSISKSGNMFKILFAAVCIIALPIYLLTSKVQLSELSSKINDAQLELEQAENEHARLQAELDNLVTIAKVEEYAREIGMQKIVTSQSKHIILDTGGTTDVAVLDDHPAGAVTRWFSGVMEYLRNN